MWDAYLNEMNVAYNQGKAARLVKEATPDGPTPIQAQCNYFHNTPQEAAWLLGYHEKDRVSGEPDERAVDRFAAAMKEKMAASRAKGRGGWDSRREVSADTLAIMLINHTYKGNAGTFEDVANFAMMLHQRGEDPKLLARMFRHIARIKAAEWAEPTLAAELEKAGITQGTAVSQRLVVHCSKVIDDRVNGRLEFLRNLLDQVVGALHEATNELDTISSTVLAHEEPEDKKDLNKLIETCRAMVLRGQRADPQI